MTLSGSLPLRFLIFPEDGSPLVRVECGRLGGQRRTSDTSAAASSPHQIQPDPQIDVQAYAPDRILEWTLPPSAGRALHHLSSLWKDMGKR